MAYMMKFSTIMIQSQMIKVMHILPTYIVMMTVIMVTPLITMKIVIPVAALTTSY